MHPRFTAALYLTAIKNHIEHERLAVCKIRHLSRYLVSPATLSLSVFALIVGDQDVFYHLARECCSLVHSRRYRPCENKCPGHTYIPRRARRLGSMPRRAILIATH